MQLLKYKLVNKTSMNHCNLLTCFRNDRRCEPFNGIISKFSLEPEKLIQDYKDVELQLIFLEKEVKTRLIPLYP